MGIVVLKMCIWSFTAAAAAVELAPNSPDRVHLRLLEEEEDDDKKIKLMVLMSTSHVAPHIARCISSIVISLIQG